MIGYLNTDCLRLIKMKHYVFEPKRMKVCPYTYYKKYKSTAFKDASLVSF